MVREWDEGGVARVSQRQEGEIDLVKEEEEMKEGSEKNLGSSFVSEEEEEEVLRVLLRPLHAMKLPLETHREKAKTFRPEEEEEHLHGLLCSFAKEQERHLGRDWDGREMEMEMVVSEGMLSVRELRDWGRRIARMR